MKVSVALLLAVLLAGCGEPITPGTATPGPATDATLRLTADVRGTSVNQLVVTVTASDIPTPLVFNIEVNNGTASGTLPLPPGPARTIAVEAFDASSVVTHDGSATVDVRPGPNPPISILLRPRAGQVPVVVTIAEVTVQVTPNLAELNAGETVQLTATILGPNDEVLTSPITWATANPALARVDQQGLVTALAPGQLLIVAVSEGVAGVSQLMILPGMPTTASVIITEFMANPSTPVDQSGEWLELHNPTNAPVNIEGWTLSDDGTDSHQINVSGAGLFIPPGGYLVLGPNADQATNGGVQVAYQYANFTIANADDEIVLKDGVGNQMDRVAYVPGWTVLPGRSTSLNPTKFDATLNDAAANWCASVTVFGGGDKGTPGAANDLCLLPSLGSLQALLQQGFDAIAGQNIPIQAQPDTRDILPGITVTTQLLRYSLAIGTVQITQTSANSAMIEVAIPNFSFDTQVDILGIGFGIITVGASASATIETTIITTPSGNRRLGAVTDIKSLAVSISVSGSNSALVDTIRSIALLLEFLEGYIFFISEPELIKAANQILPLLPEFL